MGLRTDAVGKHWPGHIYEVGREKIREYALATGLDNPVYFDRDAALEDGFRDVVAPPMFVVVYARDAMMRAMFDPEVGMDFSAMVHGAQEFEWGEPVCAGDVISTATTCSGISSKAGLGFYVFETESVNQDGEPVCHGVWTDIVRGAET